MKWKVTQGMMETEIEKARRAKKEHSGRAKREKRVIGFGGVSGGRGHFPQQTSLKPGGDHFFLANSAQRACFAPYK